MNKNHRWDTKEYEDRAKQLFRTELHKLYPSEAWALFPTLPECKNVLDLGCGNGAMSSISKKISPKIKYTGVDHQEKMINEAKIVFPHSEFYFKNLEKFLLTCGKFDCLMSWSVLKSFENWKDLIGMMISKAERYVIFDLRVANTEKNYFDRDICWADYGGIKGPIMYLNYKTLKKSILEFKENLSDVKIVSYQSEWGKFVHLKKGLNPETFLVTCILKKKNNNKSFKIFERLPGNLLK